MKQFTLLLAATLLLFLTLLSGCEKDPLKPESLPYPFNKIPLATQAGLNTFGCVINGEPWKAYEPITYWPLGRIRAKYDEPNYASDHNQRLYIWSQRQIITSDWNSDSLYSTFSFEFAPIPNVGYYDKNNLEMFEISYCSTRPKPTKTYTLDTLAPFHMYITKLDTVNKIVSGTFEMDLRRTIDTTEVLQVRHGRFDAKYQKE